MTELFTVQIVSLGSGNPDNITVRALNILHNADVILNPGKSATSIVAKLVDGARLLEKSKELSVPMSKDRSLVSLRYKEIAQDIARLYKDGKKVALTTIGDASTYSSSTYVCEELAELRVDFEISPGVPYYTAAAAESFTPLTKLEQPLLILAKVESKKELETALQQGKNVVIMKLSNNEEIIKEVLREGAYSFTYCERLGMSEDELIIKDNLDQLMQRSFPYFSLIIIKST